MSARWFVMDQASPEGINMVILPGREAAEYCSADLYGLTEGDRVFFLPASGKNLERSNYKSSLGVQRTSAIEKILAPGEGKTYIVTYPEALEELIPGKAEALGRRIREDGLCLRSGSILHKRLSSRYFLIFAQ